jgi:peptidoglycan/LPS O-acetylase OafA/YrhL
VLPDQNAFQFGTPSLATSDSFVQVAHWVALSPLRLLFAGHAAVAVFFVLSGYVLAKSVAGNATGSYLPFLICRVFRRWVRFVVAILIAALMVLLIAPRPLQGYAWISTSWSEPLSWNLVVGHLAMLGVDKYETLDSPMWGLVHEIRISTVFPLLAMAALAVPRLVVVTFASLFTLLSVRALTGTVLGLVHPGLGQDLALSGIQIVRYVFFFVLGILLVQRATPIQAALNRYRRMRWVLWLAAFALLWMPYTKWYMELAYAIDAFVLLALCLNSTLARSLLQHPSLSWLGRIPYSLYLVHMLVLLAAIHLLAVLVPTALFLPVAVVNSLLVATFADRYLELPANELGKRIARRWVASA